MRYSDLLHDIPAKTKTIEYNGHEINVLQYIPSIDRYQLIKNVMEMSFENGFYNLIKMDVHFHVALAIVYTDLEFTDEELDEQSDIYDWLSASGLMNKILEAIPQRQYESLYTDLLKSIEEDMKYRHTFAGLIGKTINELPKNIEAAKTFMDEFDPEKYQAVMEFAKAANGGRDFMDTLNLFKGI